MEHFKKRLRNVKCFVFDVDGVLTDGSIILLPTGDPVRTMNVKDGYALRHAVNKGYLIAIISGRGSDGVKNRFEKLGIEDAYLWVDDKTKKLREIMKKHNLQPDQVLYMGDDMPDFEVMKTVGIPCCPADAVHEIKEISIYISDRNGGHGCVRDVIEQTMKVQGKW